MSGAVLVLRDVTERKKLEDRLIKSEKIESLGVLAGGIAHDFNNLLNSIIANVDIATRFAKPDSEVQQSLQRAQKASTKAKELTQQLLTFSKGGAPVKRLASIADLIRDTADFGARGTNVRCQYDFAPDLWNAEVDEGQISQVIQNLVINAVQAMPQGGTIEIAARNLEIGSVTTERLDHLCEHCDAALAPLLLSPPTCQLHRRCRLHGEFTRLAPRMRAPQTSSAGFTDRNRREALHFFRP